jgi:hypothetical protein
MVAIGANYELDISNLPEELMLQWRVSQNATHYRPQVIAVAMNAR